MKKIFCAGILLSLLCMASAPGADQKQWAAWMIPASLNADKTIRVLAGRTQMLPLMLQASEAVKKQGKTHEVTLELDLPPGMKVAQSQGVYDLLKSDASAGEKGRGRYVCTVRVENRDMAGALGKRPASEWQNQTFFVEVPEAIDPGQAYVGLTLRAGEAVQSWRWAVALSELTPAAHRPRRTVLGLWSYSLGRAGAASDGIGKFLSDAGVGFIQSAPAGAFREAMKAHGIVTGGNTHHSLFYSKAAQDQDAAGKPILSNYPSPEGIIELPAEAAIPGVKSLVENARQGDGIATFDYEPRGTTGFAPRAVARFQKEHHLSDAEFKAFRAYVAKHGSQMFKVTEPAMANIWKQWTAFRSAQVEGYLRRIYQAFKAQAPEAQLAVTPSRSFGSDSMSTLALGCDNSVIGSYADIIMPQLYSGYGGINVKLVMQYTAGWRQTLAQRGAKARIWPILVVRYAGASVFNTPSRVRQQIFGTLASGAQGLLLYYPGNMDAPYWQMLARTSEEVAAYEDFYQAGQRVDGEFKLEGMPQGSGQVIMWPGYPQTVENPQWAMTAHRLKGRVLLTLFNLEEGNDLVFDFGDKAMKVLQSSHVQESGPGKWLVGPQQVGFVVVEGP